MDGSADEPRARRGLTLGAAVFVGLSEQHRVIRPGGTFLICNELGARTGESVWTEKVSGMTVYTAEQLTKLLLEAGFHDAQAHEAKTGWLYLTVRA